MAQRKAQRRGVARPAPDPGLSRRLHAPNRSGQPYLTPLRFASGKRRASPRHARSQSPAGKASLPCRCAAFRACAVPVVCHPVSQPHRLRGRVAGVWVQGFRFAPAMRRHVPHPPTLRSAPRRAQPRLFSGVALPVVVLARWCRLRLRASPGGAVVGWSWRQAVPSRRPVNLGALPQTPPGSPGARGLGAKSTPPALRQACFLRCRVKGARFAPGYAGP